MTIRELDAALAPHFARLNRAWIEQFFVMEPADEAMLADPWQLVDQGGAVRFVLVEDEVVGTGGLQRLSDTTAEIVKMAVIPSCQGQGVGTALMRALLAAARARGFTRIYLETSSRLPAARALYRKCGFKPTGQTESIHGYSRADVFLELTLAAREGNHSG